MNMQNQFFWEDWSNSVFQEILHWINSIMMLGWGGCGESEQLVVELVQLGIREVMRRPLCIGFVCNGQLWMESNTDT